MEGFKGVPILSFTRYNLAQVMPPVYRANAQLSNRHFTWIPAVNQVSIRFTVQQTYDTIISGEGAEPLPIRLTDGFTLESRPSKARRPGHAGQVLLSRNYDSARRLLCEQLLENIWQNSIRCFIGRHQLLSSISQASMTEILYQSHLLTRSGVFGYRFYSGTFL